jgi:hypothetical protein
MESPLFQQRSEWLHEDAQSLPLQQMNVEGRLVADYGGTGLTIGKHPMHYRRHALCRLGVLTASELQKRRNGEYVKTAGLAIVRQRPGTAKGVVFMSAADLGEANYPAIQQWIGARFARLSLAAGNRINCIVQLLIPALDRFMPNHHVTNDLLTLPLHPLFRGPDRRDRDRQQEYRAEDGDNDILCGRARRIDTGSAIGARIIYGHLFSLQWILPTLPDREDWGQVPFHPDHLRPPPHLRQDRCPPRSQRQKQLAPVCRDEHPTVVLRSCVSVKSNTEGKPRTVPDCESRVSRDLVDAAYRASLALPA